MEMAELKEELAALRTCLVKSGHLRTSQLAALLHRRRFEATRRRHPCRLAVAFTDLVHGLGILHPVVRFAGGAALQHVAACAPALRHSAQVSQQYAVRPARIYFLGGSSDLGPPLSSAACLDVEKGQWEELPRMPTARDVLAATAVRGRIYAVGGKDGERAYAATECYDPMLKHWHHCSPMAVARGGLGAASALDVVYAVGGSDGRRALSVVECYDTQANSWSRAFSLLTPRRGVAVAALGSCIYAVGGTDGNEVLSSVECLNTTGGVPWSPLPPMLRARRAASAAAASGRIFVVGGTGFLSPEGCMEVAECFDPSRGAWEPLPPMWQARRGLALLAAENQLLVFGGYDGQRTLGTVEVFDMNLGAWERCPLMPARRAYFGAAQTQTVEVLGMSMGPIDRITLREALRHSRATASRPSTASHFSASPNTNSPASPDHPPFRSPLSSPHPPLGPAGIAPSLTPNLPGLRPTTPSLAPTRRASSAGDRHRTRTVSPPLVTPLGSIGRSGRDRRLVGRRRISTDNGLF